MNDDDESQPTREVDEWARPSYEAAWYEYVGDGAPYGRSHAGMMRWVLEQVEAQRDRAEGRVPTGERLGAWRQRIGQVVALPARLMGLLRRRTRHEHA